MSAKSTDGNCFAETIWNKYCLALQHHHLCSEMYRTCKSKSGRSALTHRIHVWYICIYMLIWLFFVVEVNVTINIPYIRIRHGWVNKVESLKVQGWDAAEDAPKTSGDSMSFRWQKVGTSSVMLRFNVVIKSEMLLYIGWWLGHPSEKYERQLGWWDSQYMGK